MTVRPKIQRLAMTAVAIVVALTASSVLSQPSHAASGLDSGVASKSDTGSLTIQLGEGRLVIGGMRLDCASLSGDALVYANDKGYCSSGDVGAQDLREGNCGSSWFYVSNASRTGYASFLYGFQSSLGPVVFRSLRVNWSNFGHVAGSFTDNSVMANSIYQTTRERNTEKGLVNGGMTGTVTLAWGGLCEMLVPTDSGWIN